MFTLVSKVSHYWCPAWWQRHWDTSHLVWSEEIFLSGHRGQSGPRPARWTLKGRSRLCRCKVRTGQGEKLRGEASCWRRSGLCWVWEFKQPSSLPSGPQGLAQINSFFVFWTLQLAAVMWMMTYVGAIFNGVTILIIGEPSSSSSSFQSKLGFRLTNLLSPQLTLCSSPRRWSTRRKRCVLLDLLFDTQCNYPLYNSIRCSNDTVCAGTWTSWCGSVKSRIQRIWQQNLLQLSDKH